MTQSTWLRLTVAAVIENQGKFLMVQEIDPNCGIVINQPAGHLEPGETLSAAIVREVREETGLDFNPSALLGLYQWLQQDTGITYFRTCFLGGVTGNIPSPQDPEIIQACWMQPDEISQYQPRSPLVWQCINDYRNQPSAALSLIKQAQ